MIMHFFDKAFNKLGSYDSKDPIFVVGEDENGARVSGRLVIQDIRDEEEE